jgi:serine/threonine protein kinase
MSVPPSPEAHWHGKYALQAVLAEHAESATYRVSTPEGQTHILKELRLGGLKEWKRLELFEREAQTLRHLKHQGLPRLIDFFKDADDTVLCLVLEDMPGRSLLEWLADGWRPTESEVKDLAAQVLALLSYLHDHQPPIVHRDLKPSNILRDEQGNISLIDLGAAQHLLHPEGGRTVVGTFGYMPPEQFNGQASPRSDLYALGASLVHLLSGRSPAEIPLEGLRLDFSAYINVSPGLNRWLSHLLDPDPIQRYASAAQALESLHHPSSLLAVKRIGSKGKRPWWISTGIGCSLLFVGGMFYAWPPNILSFSKAASACFQSPLLHTPPQEGTAAEAFRQDFRQRFPLPTMLKAVNAPAISTQEELNTLWRCQAQRSDADLVFFKAAWQLIVHSPLDDEGVANAISLMTLAWPDYPQRAELLAFGVEKYHGVVSNVDWDRPGVTAARLVLAYSKERNRVNDFEGAQRWSHYLLSKRASEINDHTLQLLTYEYAYALWKSGKRDEAMRAIDHALKTYTQGDWKAKLEKLREQMAAS